MIHSGINLCVWSEEYRPQLHFFTCGYPLVTDHLLKRLSFTEWSWHSYRKSNWPQVYGFTSGISILFHWLIYISNLMLIVHYFTYSSSFIVRFGVVDIWVPSKFVFFSVWLWLFGICCIPYEFEAQFLHFCKEHLEFW